MEKEGTSRSFAHSVRSVAYKCFDIIENPEKKRKVVCKFCGNKREPIPDRMCKHVMQCAHSSRIPHQVVVEVKEEMSKRARIKSEKRSVTAPRSDALSVPASLSVAYIPVPTKTADTFSSSSSSSSSSSLASSPPKDIQLAECIVACGIPARILGHPMWQRLLEIAMEDTEMALSLGQDEFLHTLLPQIQAFALEETKRLISASSHYSIVCQVQRVQQALRCALLVVTDQGNSVPLLSGQQTLVSDVQTFHELFIRAHSQLEDSFSKTKSIISIVSPNLLFLVSARDISCSSSFIFSLTCASDLLNRTFLSFFSPKVPGESLCKPLENAIAVVALLNRYSSFWEDVDAIALKKQRLPKLFASPQLQGILEMVKSLQLLQESLVAAAKRTEGSFSKDLKEILLQESFWQRLGQLQALLSAVQTLSSVYLCHQTFLSDVFFLLLFLHVFAKSLSLPVFIIRCIRLMMKELLSIEYGVYLLSYYLDNRYRGLFLDSEAWEEILKFSFFSQACKQGFRQSDCEEAFRRLRDFSQQKELLSKNPLHYWSDYVPQDCSSAILRDLALLCMRATPFVTKQESDLFTLKEALTVPSVMGRSQAESNPYQDLEFFIRRKYNYSVRPEEESDRADPMFASNLEAMSCAKENLWNWGTFPDVPTLSSFRLESPIMSISVSFDHFLDGVAISSEGDYPVKIQPLLALLHEKKPVVSERYEPEKMKAPWAWKRLSD